MSDFIKTNWDMVAVAGSADRELAEPALDHLYRDYWGPVYAFLRRSGESRDDAMDETQEFFLAFVEKNLAARADPAKGRFRNYLLTCVRHFLGDRRAMKSALKRRPRGGFQLPERSSEQDDGRATIEAIASRAPSPEQAFETAWARSTFERAIGRLQIEKGDRFGRDGFNRLLRHCLDPDPPSYRDSARQLGLSEAAVKMTVSRLRRSIATAIEVEILDQQSTPPRGLSTTGSSARDDVRTVLESLAAEPR